MGDPDFNKIFNVNSSVEIKLTNRGRVIYIQERSQASLDGLDSRTGVDGYVSLQLHSVMSIFGKHMNMGCPLPFETRIRMKSTDLVVHNG